MRMGNLLLPGLGLLLVLLPPVGLAAVPTLDGGVQAWSSQRHGQALASWRPLAEAGDAQAQLYLAYAYRRGLGVARDDVQAAHWYRRAAEQGLADAQYQLGLMYELGLGVAADPAEAEYWYGLAVGQGYCPGELSAGGILGD